MPRLGTMFRDRTDAGRRLAPAVEHLRGPGLVVLGLPRGGVPVAAEVAHALGAPLDVLVVRKLGVPFQPELAMGAIGEGGVRVLNEEVLRAAEVSTAELAAVEAGQQAELARRANRYRSGRTAVPLEGRTALVVDDGIATGSTARAACQVARARGAGRVVLAVPVAPREWTARIGDAADECIALATPEPFFAIGQFYEDFSQTSDDEVVACLARPGRAEPSRGPGPPCRTRAPAGDPPPRDDEVTVAVSSALLGGHLTVPQSPLGAVLFAHGSGSSRHSPRNRYVASVLNGAQIATLLFDLLTADEESWRANVFDIELLAGRLVEATRWMAAEPGCTGLPLGYFGASTGAGAALWAAGELGPDIAAVVSRGGRPDLAAGRLDRVLAPTLLIVGERDELVLDLNRQAQAALRGETRLAVVPGATHLFEEAGTLQTAAELARDWFRDHFQASRAMTE